MHFLVKILLCELSNLNKQLFKPFTATVLHVIYFHRTRLIGITNKMLNSLACHVSPVFKDTQGMTLTAALKIQTTSSFFCYKNSSNSSLAFSQKLSGSLSYLWLCFFSNFQEEAVLFHGAIKQFLIFRSWGLTLGSSRECGPFPSSPHILCAFYLSSVEVPLRGTIHSFT